jgi:hypothetical protein
MKLIMKTPRPRNPLVAASRSRHAGAHGKSNGAKRQQAERGLRQEIERLRPSP